MTVLTAPAWIAVAALRDRLISAGFEAEVSGSPDVLVSGATHDSRAVVPARLFACLRGDAFDGHDFATQAVDAGATALLVDHRIDLGAHRSATQIIVGDTRRAVGVVAAAAWGDPADRLTTIGVTGTNGKTTTAQIAAALMEGAGHPTGIVGTLHGPRTTPEAPDLHETLVGFVDASKTAAVMEVSSHALTLHRIDGTRFDVVAFTNFGRDHLDLHGSPEAYFRAKSALFTSRFAPVAVINVDDTHGRLLADTISDRSGADAMRVVEVSERDVADIVVTASSHSYTWRGHHVVVALGGDFNVANSLMALSIASEAGCDLTRAIAGLSVLEPVPGRFEVVNTAETDEREITVVVDYAHTPDGLERLLEAARRLSEGRLIAVFGCAGRRDREKRPLMGEVASRLADQAIATSDNPRGEDPDGIIDEVIAGAGERYRARVTAQPDRRVAIREALAAARAGDIVVVAGKGHELYQDLGDEIIDFDDRRVVREELTALSRHEASVEEPS